MVYAIFAFSRVGIDQLMVVLVIDRKIFPNMVGKNCVELRHKFSTMPERIITQRVKINFIPLRGNSGLEVRRGD